MKHQFRFHGSRIDVRNWLLSPEEWHHAIKVLRLNPGDGIEICDGKGWIASAELETVGKSGGTLRVQGEGFTSARSSSSQLTLGVGVLKPQSMDEILPALVELGVDQVLLVPFRGMERSRLQNKLLERWERIIITAAKQSKAAWFMKLKVFESFGEFLEHSESFGQRYLLDPDAPSLFRDLPSEFAENVLALIGSEGGWDQAECQQLLDYGFKGVRLNTHILRATTACIATASLFRQKLP